MSTNKISLRGITPEEGRFHNERIPIYRTNVAFDQITYWPENHRTVLAFDVLVAREGGADLKDIDRDVIIEFIAKRRGFKIPDLAESIRKNGVKVPLILAEDGTLLDGNRRYFACAYLDLQARKKKCERPEVLEKIPVMVIKAKDLSKESRLKVIAEANYVPDYKVPWSLDVKAKVVTEFYNSLKKTKTHEEAIEESASTFGEEATQVWAYIESLEIADQYVKSAPKAERNEYRERVEGKFLYFWEYRNKALYGRSHLDSRLEPKARAMFFKMTTNGSFSSFKQVEPMVRATRDKYLWEMIVESDGKKIDLVEALYKEEKAVRSLEDKVRAFLNWLDTKLPTAAVNEVIHDLLIKISDKIKILTK